VRSVLIYDDEPVIRAGIKTKLKELGFDLIFVCFDGSSAISTACETLPDIAILNAMPKNDGLRAARAIRQKLDIPVILLMSFCDPDTLNRAKKVGITTILTKPFLGQDLLPAIEMAFAHADREAPMWRESVFRGE
jgi:response regulator NasT